MHLQNTTKKEVKLLWGPCQQTLICHFFNTRPCEDLKVKVLATRHTFLSLFFSFIRYITGYHITQLLYDEAGVL
jgi:hypothetical protein